MKSKKLISIVTPCYNEEKNVHDHFRRISKVIRPFELDPMFIIDYPKEFSPFAKKFSDSNQQFILKLFQYK